MRDAVIIGAVRTPVGRRNGGLSGVHPVDLAGQVLQDLGDRTGFDPADVDDVILGCVSQTGEQSWNIGRNAVLAAGWPESVPGTTLDRQCGSSQQALHFAAAGYAVSVADPVADAGAEIGELLRERGVEALVCTTDVADAAAVANWMKQTVEALGCPDVLINNAGIMIRKPFLELPQAQRLAFLQSVHDAAANAERTQQQELDIPAAERKRPFVLMMKELGWLNSTRALIVPGACSAFGVFLMRQYIGSAVPRELVEAARMDGCSTFRTYWNVVLPGLRPAIAVLGLFTFMEQWNSFLWPQIALGDPLNPTVQLSLQRLSQGYYNDYSQVFAGTLLSVVPLLVIFIIFGRQIIGGIMEGSVKA